MNREELRYLTLTATFFQGVNLGPFGCAGMDFFGECSPVVFLLANAEVVRAGRATGADTGAGAGAGEDAGVDTRVDA